MRLAVLTSGRQDWGILRSTCRLLRSDPAFDLRLWVGGMHASARFGARPEEIAADGYRIRELSWLREEGETLAEEQAAGALRETARALREERPEALLLVGDRLETAAAALAGTLAGVPLVHLHGGEESEGAFDNQLRHATTKLSHLHLVSHPAHARRVLRMGEPASTVRVVGAPGLDNLHREDLPSRAELEARLGLPLTPPLLLVTLHPSTLGGDARAEGDALVAALDAVDATCVISLPNADPGQEALRRLLERAGARPRRTAVPALGERAYWGLLKLADAMAGNSSSGLIEAPAVGLPVVNVGDRQKGRLRGANVIDVSSEPAAIAEGLRRALDPAFRAQVRKEPSPYGDGRSAPRIVDILRSWRPPVPPRKRFEDSEGGS